MRNIGFGDSSFRCVYSWNSSILLTKADTGRAVGEMMRVLKPRGLLYVNFIWEVARETYLGEERAPGERWMTAGGTEVVHSLYSGDEADPLFEWHLVLLKKRREIEMRHGERPFIDGYIDYIVRKACS